MTIDNIALIEAILMAADEPLTLDEIYSVVSGDGLKKADILDALKALRVMLEEDQGGVELVEVASGWRLQVPARFAKWVGKLYEEKQNRYSTALFETIALIAYQQPVTRGDIEAVRGVTVSSNIIKTLEEREWIKVIGRRETPGRPMLYATTEQFLDDFNLKSIEELPLLPELEELLENGGEEDSPELPNGDESSSKEKKEAKKSTPKERKKASPPKAEQREIDLDLQEERENREISPSQEAEKEE